MPTSDCPFCHARVDEAGACSVCGAMVAGVGAPAVKFDAPRPAPAMAPAAPAPATTTPKAPITLLPPGAPPVLVWR